MPNQPSKYRKALHILREISGTLNKSTDIYEMLRLSLEHLLDLMDLETGWVFLTENEKSYELAASHQLPPALDHHREELMHCNEGSTDCACLALYWEGHLKQAVNHVKCVRLGYAVNKDMGDTCGLTHHASIPLTIRGKKIGLLNLASLGRRYFHEDDLVLLETVAYQIGSAVERTRLHLEKTDAEVHAMARYLVDSYANAEKINRQIGNILNRKQLFREFIQLIHSHMPSWTHSAIVTMEDEKLTVQVCSDHQGTREVSDTELEHNLSDPDLIRQVYVDQKIRQAEGTRLHFPSLNDHKPLYSIALPLFMPEIPEETFGVLLLSRETSMCDDLEIGMLEMLASHLSMAIERVRLHEEWEALLVEKERNRLARDLHDSVNQKLFALLLTSRGLHDMLAEQGDTIMNALRELQQLSKEALTDMRSLIWQLRPDHLDQGLVASLINYAQTIGVDLSIEAAEDVELNPSYEESLLKIGQEALNNIQKHAGTTKATIIMQADSHNFTMRMIDQGAGGAAETNWSLGITSMKERTEELQGAFHMKSESGKGTIITIRVPLS